MLKPMGLLIGVLTLAAPALADGAERLRAFEAFHKELGAAAATFTTQAELPEADFRNETKMELRMQRPNRLHLRPVDGQNGSTLISDGKQLFTGIDAGRRYTLRPAPETFAAWHTAASARRRPIPTPGADFLLELLGAQTVIADPANLKHAGTEEIGGHPCDRFVAETPERTITLWIGSDTPWLWRFRSDTPSLRMMITFQDWKSTLPADAAFAIQPAEGWTRVESLLPGGGAAKQPDKPTPRRGARPQASSGGEPAAAFEADLLDGKTMNLADHLGKDVIVLDFWATWCKPCLMGLPAMSEETAARKDRGVAFFAVNIGEVPEKVQKLMDSKEWTFPVVMDRNAKIAKSYGVGPIPHSVVIGKDGKIAHVHVGYSSGLRARLSAELDALLK